MAKKWLDSIEKQKRRINDCDKQTDGHTDSQRQKIIDSEVQRSMTQRKIITTLSEVNCYYSLSVTV